MSTTNESWITDEAPPALDRSTLEDWATCPAQARLKSAGVATQETDAMVSGSEAHKALSQAIADHIDTAGELPPDALADAIQSAARSTRPDVQPDACDALYRAAWSIGRYIYGIHPHNVMRYDGGEGDRTGQMTKIYTVGNDEVDVTSEVDLLIAGPAPTVLHEIDWKTGRTPWTATKIAGSFQFQCHAVLIFEHYPDVRELELIVWDTRRNQRTQPVVFKRSRLRQYDTRVRSTVALWHKHHDDPDPPAWPTVEKCELCPVAARCPMATETVAEVATDPFAALRQLIVKSQDVDTLKKALVAHVDAHGTITLPDGVSFGRVPSTRKPTAKFYQSEDNDE